MAPVDKGNDENRGLWPRVKPEVQHVDASGGTEMPPGLLPQSGSLKKTPTDWGGKER
jgi:hypothetical protein